ncbi:unnamed protein product [Gadus morhua 'NCC']
MCGSVCVCLCLVACWFGSPCVSVCVCLFDCDSVWVCMYEFMRVSALMCACECVCVCVCVFVAIAYLPRSGWLQSLFSAPVLINPSVNTSSPECIVPKNTLTHTHTQTHKHARTRAGRRPRTIAVECQESACVCVCVLQSTYKHTSHGLSYQFKQGLEIGCCRAVCLCLINDSFGESIITTLAAVSISSVHPYLCLSLALCHSLLLSLSLSLCSLALFHSLSFSRSLSRSIPPSI